MVALLDDLNHHPDGSLSKFGGILARNGGLALWHGPIFSSE
jgi:hypothetical protein